MPSQSNVTERKGDKIFATQRGYGEWKAAGKREQSQTRLSYAEREQARLEGKAGWEFPGGKMEAGETPEVKNLQWRFDSVAENKLKREIREELSTDISVDKFLCTVEYDYPAFGLRPFLRRDSAEPKRAFLCSRCSVVSSDDALLSLLAVDGSATLERT